MSPRPERPRSLAASIVAAALALGPAAALAEAPADRMSAGGYFRIMARPDLEGGNSKLGFWNLTGRLMNEGPWGALELKLDVLQPSSGRRDPWASVFAKIEGGSFANADAGRGNLSNYASTQLYVRAGNVLFDRVTWQLGTLYAYTNDLGLYDFRPAELFYDTVGLSARYDVERLELLVGLGDAGYFHRGASYSPILTGGGWARFRIVRGFEIGVGGQVRHEPSVDGNRYAPYATPGVRYEDLLRQEVAKRWLDEHPGQESLFPKPAPRAASSWKAIAFAGFGGWGPLRWNTVAANVQRLHPLGPVTETLGGRDYTVYLTDLTDQRYQVTVGNEMQLAIVDGRLDAVWSVYWSRAWNLDVDVRAPSDDDRTVASTVLRLQLYLTATVHLLVESSAARERSDKGNLYREHADSIFRNTGGTPDSRGLETGDTDTRNTWQVKGGVVLNPTGRGVFTRPSLRLLYGLQYSNVQAAYGNGFVESLDQFNVFQGPERHWHSVVAIEAEAWF